MKNQCHQAVAAVAAGTTIYFCCVWRYLFRCSTDTDITPCQTMQQIASAPQNFFSDDTASAGDGSCIFAAQRTST